MKILFQGDSITDAGRDRSDPHLMGEGYPKYAAQFVTEAYPKKQFEFINLGIGGDRTWELLDRWKSDCIDIQPDIVSILIGVNDTWRRYDRNDPTTAEQYEENYRKLLCDIKKNTHAKIIILEPYLLSVDKDHFREDLDFKIDVSRKLAREYADAFVPLDGLFASASLEHEPKYWSADGIHPSSHGAEFIGRHYLDAACKLIGE